MPMFSKKFEVADPLGAPSWPQKLFRAQGTYIKKAGPLARSRYVFVPPAS